MDIVFCVLAALLFISFGQCEHLFKFPTNFKLGCASSAFQIEGAWNIDGKGESIWDHVSHVSPDFILNRQNADVATDSYHRYKEDVQMLKHIGVDFYRFSISWTRVLPNGDTSIINEAGLQYYDNLINELIANGIEPMITMYHWDLPQALQEKGGINSPAFVEHFEKYAEVLFNRFHDRVNKWITFNEPNVFCNHLFINRNPPYLNKVIRTENYICAHHVLLANANVYDLYKRKYAKEGDKVGISLDFWYAFPKDANSTSDIEATECFLQFNMVFAHPIFSRNGDYPKIMRDIVDRNSEIEKRPKSRLPIMTEEERNLIRGKADFFGINYYTSKYVTTATECDVCVKSDIEVDLSVDENWPKGKSMFMYSIPEGLRGLLNYVRTEYDNPEVIITENGWSDDGELDDVNRISYLQSHLKAILNAINDGCNVTAYTTWSLMDNFEWIAGYSERFGLYHVDFDSANRTRTPKASVGYLREVIATKSLPHIEANHLIRG